MTAYSAIPSGDIDPDSPVTTGLITLLRDNPIASFEKASGAPVLAQSYVEGGMLEDMTAGDEIISYWSSSVRPASGAFPTNTKIIECRAGQDGVVRVSRTHDNSTMYTVIYLNGVIETTTVTGSGVKTDDVTVSEGDLIQIYGNCSSDGCSGDTISSIKIGVANGVGVVGDWFI